MIQLHYIDANHDQMSRKFRVYEQAITKNLIKIKTKHLKLITSKSFCSLGDKISHFSKFSL